MADYFIDVHIVNLVTLKILGTDPLKLNNTINYFFIDQNIILNYFYSLISRIPSTSTLPKNQLKNHTHIHLVQFASNHQLKNLLKDLLNTAVDMQLTNMQVNNCSFQCNVSLKQHFSMFSKINRVFSFCSKCSTI